MVWYNLCMYLVSWTNRKKKKKKRKRQGNGVDSRDHGKFGFEFLPRDLGFRPLVADHLFEVLVPVVHHKGHVLPAAGLLNEVLKRLLLVPALLRHDLG